MSLIQIKANRSYHANKRSELSFKKDQTFYVLYKDDDEYLVSSNDSNPFGYTALNGFVPVSLFDVQETQELCPDTPMDIDTPFAFQIPDFKQPQPFLPPPDDKASGKDQTYVPEYTPESLIDHNRPFQVYKTLRNRVVYRK
ncbi:hypothetical protein SAGO17_0039 [Mimivirus AB-566-O17]|uniref:SH3 domain-containing protein n=1 Tax=Mimivirus AB-566-O17 TaxID=1988039 RepID=A0A1X9VNR8_9VIRU|nr:hypothetical protein SAGO17_0039 [Mimivirus AB-566-O17]